MTGGGPGAAREAAHDWARWAAIDFAEPKPYFPRFLRPQAGVIW